LCSETRLNAKPQTVIGNLIKTMQKIYFDESGNTGADLLNLDQKAFILCSNNFSTEECEELLKLFENDAELHFVKLKKSSKGRESIIKLLNHELIREEKVAIYVVHKELATIAQIVDQLIEPVFYEKGLDLYKFGLNIQYTNFIFYFGNFFWNKALYNEMITNFISMFRKRDSDSINKFYKTVEELIETVDDEYLGLLYPIRESKPQILRILENSDKFTIDVTFSCFLVLCDRWYKVLGEKFDVIFDNSKQIEHYSEYIEFVRNLKVEIQEVGFDSRKMTYPAQINSVQLTDSKSEVNIQISDIIASAIGFMYNNKNNRHTEFVKKIQESKILNLENANMIWPTTEVTPEELNMQNGEGNNVLDFLAEQFIREGK